MALTERRLTSNKIGQNVRKQRKLTDLSQQNLADKLRLSRVSVVNIEKGRQGDISVWMLKRIARILKIHYRKLLYKV